MLSVLLMLSRSEATRDGVLSRKSENAMGQEYESRFQRPYFRPIRHTLPSVLPPLLIPFRPPPTRMKTSLLSALTTSALSSASNNINVNARFNPLAIRSRGTDAECDSDASQACINDLECVQQGEGQECDCAALAIACYKDNNCLTDAMVNSCMSQTDCSASQCGSDESGSGSGSGGDDVDPCDGVDDACYDELSAECQSAFSSGAITCDCAEDYLACYQEEASADCAADIVDNEKDWLEACKDSVPSECNDQCDDFVTWAMEAQDSASSLSASFLAAAVVVAVSLF